MIKMTALNDLIQAAHHIVFLTGAGVSTASGIPDYRSKNGLYAHGESPEYLLSHDCLVEHPKLYYDFVKHNLFYPNAKPNIIHQKMATLTRDGKAMIITQNIDDLHAQADPKSGTLIEFHGDLYDVYCQKCYTHVDWHQYLKSMYHQNCGGILRSNIVLYGEGIDEQKLARSIAAVEQADLIVVVGTSFVVYPFAGLLQYRPATAKVVAVNEEPITLPPDGIMIINDATKEFAKV